MSEQNSAVAKSAAVDRIVYSRDVLLGLRGEFEKFAAGNSSLTKTLFHAAQTGDFRATHVERQLNARIHHSAGSAAEREVFGVRGTTQGRGGRSRTGGDSEWRGSAGQEQPEFDPSVEGAAAEAAAGQQPSPSATQGKYTRRYDADFSRDHMDSAPKVAPATVQRTWDYRPVNGGESTNQQHNFAAIRALVDNGLFEAHEIELRETGTETWIPYPAAKATEERPAPPPVVAEKPRYAKPGAWSVNRQAAQAASATSPTTADRPPTPPEGSTVPQAVPSVAVPVPVPVPSVDASVKIIGTTAAPAVNPWTRQKTAAELLAQGNQSGGARAPVATTRAEEPPLQQSKDAEPPAPPVPTGPTQPAVAIPAQQQQKGDVAPVVVVPSITLPVAPPAKMPIVVSEPPAAVPPPAIIGGDGLPVVKVHVPLPADGPVRSEPVAIPEPTVESDPKPPAKKERKDRVPRSEELTAGSKKPAPAAPAAAEKEDLIPAVDVPIAVPPAPKSNPWKKEPAVPIVLAAQQSPPAQHTASAVVHHKPNVNVVELTGGGRKPNQLLADSMPSLDVLANGPLPKRKDDGSKASAATVAAMTNDENFWDTGVKQNTSPSSTKPSEKASAPKEEFPAFEVEAAAGQSRRQRNDAKQAASKANVAEVDEPKSASNKKDLPMPKSAKSSPSEPVKQTSPVADKPSPKNDKRAKQQSDAVTAEPESPTLPVPRSQVEASPTEEKKPDAGAEPQLSAAERRKQKKRERKKKSKKNKKDRAAAAANSESDDSSDDDEERPSAPAKKVEPKAIMKRAADEPKPEEAAKQSPGSLPVPRSQIQGSPTKSNDQKATPAQKAKSSDSSDDSSSSESEGNAGEKSKRKRKKKNRNKRRKEKAAAAAVTAQQIADGADVALPEKKSPAQLNRSTVQPQRVRIRKVPVEEAASAPLAAQPIATLPQNEGGRKRSAPSSPTEGAPAAAQKEAAPNKRRERRNKKGADKGGDNQQQQQQRIDSPTTTTQPAQQRFRYDPSRNYDDDHHSPNTKPQGGDHDGEGGDGPKKSRRRRNRHKDDGNAQPSTAAAAEAPAPATIPAPKSAAVADSKDAEGGKGRKGGGNRYRRRPPGVARPDGKVE